MRVIVGKCSVLFWFYLIEHIFGTQFYEINYKYPIAVKPFHGASNIVERRFGRHEHGKGSIEQVDNKGEKELDTPISIRKKPRHVTEETFCVRCPKAITAVAREGLDGILVEPPSPRACRTNLPFSENLFKIETLFGPDMPFILPKGRHSFHAKIRNVETGLVIRSCVLKYHVIVRHCKGYPNLINKNVSISCTAGMIWGSKCAFGCKNQDEYLTHREPMICNEKLLWSGTEPNCTPNMISDNNVYLKDEPVNNGNIGEFCSQPAPPEYARYVCEAKNNDFQELSINLKENNIENLKTMAPGSTCHVLCDHGYSIPYHLYSLSKIECMNGAWNSTDIDFCYKTAPQRRHLSRGKRT